MADLLHESTPAERPPPRVPPEPVRRIDWLAIAPWLIILRAPRATVGWPWLIAALGTVALGPTAIRVATGFSTAGMQVTPIAPTLSEVSALVTPPGVDRLATLGDGSLALGGGRGALAANGTTEPPDEWLSWLAFAGWLVAAVPIAASATGVIVGSPSGSRRSVLRAMPAAVGRLAGAALLLLTLVASLGAAAWALGAAIGAPVVAWGAASLAGVAWLLCVALRLVSLLAVTLSPILVAAVVVDRADPFDAVSRLVAYTLQRPLTLLGCYAVAAVAGWLSASLLELALGGVERSFGMLVGSAPEGAIGEAFDVSVHAARVTARSFYHAYPFVAGVAIYLVMRQAIDGQPFDEATPSSDAPGSNDQPASSDA